MTGSNAGQTIPEEKYVSVATLTSGPDFEAITSRVKAKYGLMVPITRLLDGVRHLGKGPFPYADDADAWRSLHTGGQQVAAP